MGKRKVNVQQGKQGFQPTDHSAGKVSPIALADDLARAKGPADTSLTAGMSAEQVNSIYDGFAARKEAERLAEERRPLVEAMLAEERQERWRQSERERQELIDEYDALPDTDKPVLDQQQIDLLTDGDTRLRNLMYGIPPEQHGKAIVGYLAKKQKRDISNPGFGGPTPPSRTATEEVDRSIAKTKRAKYIRDISDPAYGHYL